MKLARVIGSVSPMRKEMSLTGKTLLAVRYLDADLNETAATAASIDTVGAGPGDLVIVCSSSSARLTTATAGTCTDSAIVGIVETIAASARMIYPDTENDPMKSGGGV